MTLVKLGLPLPSLLLLLSNRASELVIERSVVDLTAPARSTRSFHEFPRVTRERNKPPMSLLKERNFYFRHSADRVYSRSSAGALIGDTATEIKSNFGF